MTHKSSGPQGEEAYSGSPMEPEVHHTCTTCICSGSSPARVCGQKIFVSNYIFT